MAEPNTVHLVPVAHYVQVPIAAALTGYTEKAIRRKIEEGHWLAGREYIKAPDGHILISMKGFAAWAERGPASKPANDPSASLSRSKGSSTATR